jgi:uncharacterized OB-fold protein
LPNEGRKAGTIQYLLWKEDKLRLNDYEVLELLRKLETKGLIVSERVNWTERIIRELRASKKIHGKACPKCSNKTVSLYAQMRDEAEGKESKRVVGSFCPACGYYSLNDPGGLVERFVG